MIGTGGNLQGAASQGHIPRGGRMFIIPDRLGVSVAELTVKAVAQQRTRPPSSSTQV